MTEAKEGGTVPVVLVVHRQVDPESESVYAAWQERVGAAVAVWPGALDREVLPPRPPAQVDWIVIQRFRDGASARSWLQSRERAELLAEIETLRVSDDDVHLFTDERRHISEASSVLISSRVAEGDEKDYLAWQRTIAAAESRFPGFVGHRVERPVPGVQDNWVVVLSFDTDEHLTEWLDSSERRALLASGERFNTALTLTRASSGFGFWSDAPAVESVFKNNLLVLLMLYPLVFLWGYFVSEPLIDSHGVPFWVSLFIGNLVSTQLLGWILVPWIFRRFSWWLQSRGGLGELLGYLLVVLLYALSMALYAWLLAIRS